MDQEQNSSGGGRSKPWGAFNIVKRPNSNKSYWNRIGSAFLNHDGSWNIYMDSIPIDGKVQIREIKDDDRAGRRDRGDLAAAGELTRISDA